MAYAKVQFYVQIGRFPDVICSSSCRFLLDFYAQNAATNSFDIPSNLTLMEQQVYREQLYLLITWNPPVGECCTEMIVIFAPSK